MNLSDTFYIALCMTILILGVVYWFWTQNQFVLRKLNLLNNIVFEMRASQPSKEDIPVPASVYPPAPGSELGEDEDLVHEELHNEVESMRLAAASATVGADEVKEFSEPEADSKPVATEQVGTSIEELAEPLENDLQPGGVGSSVKEVVSSNVLESMTIKELRRLAEQRGVSGTSNMKKPAVLAALREKPVATPFEMVAE
jgi:hypothetical protein